MATSPKLTDKQEQFCREYPIDLNATQAAIRAGYSEKTANREGSRLLSNVDIQNFLTELKKERSERTDITAEMVLKELAKIGFSNIQDYIGAGNETQDLSQIDKSKAAAISGIKVTSVSGEGYEKTTVEFKLHDKIAALEKIAKHIGFFEKDNSQQKGNTINLTNLTYDELLRLAGDNKG